MRERPIICSAESVRAILRGEKSQTRRVIAPKLLTEFSMYRLLQVPLQVWRDLANRCPYGQHGDRLWVRETWAPWNVNCPRQRICYRADMQKGAKHE